jgi:hypothetical protein
MRIVVDESVDGRVIDRLRLAGHDIESFRPSAVAPMRTRRHCFGLPSSPSRTFT